MQKIISFIKSLPLDDYGFSKLDCNDALKGYEELNYAITIVVKLNTAIVSKIIDAPTHEYFHHYRTANTKLDLLTFDIAREIEKMGFLALPIASSQSINNGQNGYNGLLTHKKYAIKGGLGTIGKNGLFISLKYGPMVRLATILTNLPFEIDGELFYEDVCGDCEICFKACPAGAIFGHKFNVLSPTEPLLDVEKCSRFMKDKFMNIGRGSVCGVCGAVCPHSIKNK